MLSETKRQVINLWNCCIWLVNLFELYDDATDFPKSNQYFSPISLAYKFYTSLLKKETACSTAKCTPLLDYVPFWHNIMTISGPTFCVNLLVIFFSKRVRKITPNYVRPAYGVPNCGACQSQTEHGNIATSGSKATKRLELNNDPYRTLCGPF